MYKLNKESVCQVVLGAKKMITLRTLKNVLSVMVRSNSLLKELLGINRFINSDHVLKMQDGSILYAQSSPQINHSYYTTNKDNRNSSIIKDCLKKMPELQRNIFVYKTYEGMETSLICHYFNIDEVTFWKDINKARSELIATLEIN